jgi:hypothetical protein
MKLRMLMQTLAFAATATCLVASLGFANSQYCRHVGGGVLTNFLPPYRSRLAASYQNLCTDGTSTGDIRGSVGVSILGINGNVYHVHHHWVTESGDTIFAKDVFLTAFPTSDPNRVLADYLKGLEIIGGRA